ncbi:MAG: hypothetical protein KDA72_18730 [Planctomycetales bacterium]|nr:hypothetical protein [Planctomycetales bacterium]
MRIGEGTEEWGRRTLMAGIATGTEDYGVGNGEGGGDGGEETGTQAYGGGYGLGESRGRAKIEDPTTEYGAEWLRRTSFETLKDRR